MSLPDDVNSMFDSCVNSLLTLGVQYVVVVIVIIVLILALIIASVIIQKNHGRTARSGVKQTADSLNELYWKNVRASLAAEEARQYDKAIANICAIRSACTDLIKTQSRDSASRVVSAARQVRKEADSRKATLKRDADYYCYLALHYASHLAGNEIHLARERMKELRNSSFENLSRLNREIDSLKSQQASGARNRNEISKACKAHKNTSILLNIYTAGSKELYAMELDQNNQTAFYRDYIRDHFGERGLRWYKRLMARKAAIR